jgi:hypothetical protein
MHGALKGLGIELELAHLAALHLDHRDPLEIGREQR